MLNSKLIKLFIFFTGIIISLNCIAQFTGASGVYYLGTANVPIPASSYSNPNISGVIVRFRWNDTEPSPGNFNWTFIDGEIAKAVTYNKKVSLQPLATPAWLDSIGTQQYYYIDNNTAHPTYGQVVSGVIPWDSIYVKRYKILLQNLAAKYASNPNVTYINTIGGAFSRNLPDTILIDTTLKIKHAFWTAYNYNADSLAKLVNAMTDYYMQLFPSTHLWCSVDYVKFEIKASGRPINYLASLITNHGIANYTDRFGLWREDLSGCNPQLPISTGNQWYILQQNPCRIGAQMLWNVQDGPARMNVCGMLPNTKTVVLDSAVNKGLSLGMRYLEIYGVDIDDASLVNSIQQANAKLIAKGLHCDSVNGIVDNKQVNTFNFYPNPAKDILFLSINGFNIQNTVVFIYNIQGQFLFHQQIKQEKTELNINSLAKGMYIVKVLNENKTIVSKFVKE